MNLTQLSSVFQRIRRNFCSSPFLHLATTSTIAFCLLIIGALAVLYVNVNDLIGRWQDKIRVVAYTSSGLSLAQVQLLRQNLLKLHGVENVRYISKQEAMAQLRRQMRHRLSLLDGLDKNPLPASFEIRLTRTCTNWQRVTVLANQIKGFAEIDDVEYGKQWLQRFAGFIAFFRLTGIIIGSLILTATVFVCANTIRLTLYARKQELEIMRLVGASDGFITTPLHIQNFIQGLLGGFAALALLFGTHKLFVEKVQASEALLSTFDVRFLPPTGTAALLSAGMVIGWFGSYLSVRRFLRP